MPRPLRPGSGAKFRIPGVRAAALADLPEWASRMRRFKRGDSPAVDAHLASETARLESGAPIYLTIKAVEFLTGTRLHGEPTQLLEITADETATYAPARRDHHA